MATSAKVEMGAAYLTTPVTEEHFLTPEKFDEEQRQIQEAAATFIQREVLPKTERIRHQEEGLVPSLLKLAGEQGLLMIDVPEEYGGADLGLVVSGLVAHEMRESSFAVAFGAHTGIGTLPIVCFGTDAAEAQVPAQAGHRRVHRRLRAHRAGRRLRRAGRQDAAPMLSPDGKHWILNGAKQCITNAGFADVFIVFAKVDGDEVHRLHRRARHARASHRGAEEHKMGIRGSLDVPALSSRTCRCPSRTCWARSARATRSPSTS